MPSFRDWLHNLFVDDDEAIGGLAPKSLPGETISARAGKARNHGALWGCVLCKLLGLIDKDHCDKAIEDDKLRAQAVLDDLQGEQ